MAYYMGDYYRGDYYRGDFWSKAKKKVKKVAKIAAPFIAPKDAARYASMIPGVGNALGGIAGVGMPAMGSSWLPAVPAVAGGAAAAGKAVIDWAMKNPKTAAAGAAGAASFLGIGGGSGGSSRFGRRMNVTNPKALRRAMRRVEGFAHLAKSTIRFTNKVKMKKRGRK